MILVGYFFVGGGLKEDISETAQILFVRSLRRICFLVVGGPKKDTPR